MPIKETDDQIIFIETINKSTLEDLIKFKENSSILIRFGMKSDGIDKLADSVTKLMAESIKANLIMFLEENYIDKEERGKNGKKK